MSQTVKIDEAAQAAIAEFDGPRFASPNSIEFFRQARTVVRSEH